MKKKSTDLVKTSQVGQIQLTPEQERRLEQALPEWAKEIATNVNAVMRTNTEIMYLIQGLLAQEFGFSEAQNKHLIDKIKETLPTLNKFKARGIVLLNPNTMKAFLDTVEINKKQLKQENSGLALPTKNEIKKLGDK